MLAGSGDQTGELVWLRRAHGVAVCLWLDQGGRNSPERPWAQVSNLSVPVVTSLNRGDVVYRCPVQVRRRAGRLVAGPVYAVLAAAGAGSFRGNRREYRDLLQAARHRREFVYVLPADGVHSGSHWTGYVRLGQRWLALPCPRPEAVYNRIPNRSLEAAPDSRQAKQTLFNLSIPFFNPAYFDKATLYEVLKEAHLGHWLPDTCTELSLPVLARECASIQACT
ncbi:MAG: YheC/YheD family protein [Alicyclobacillus sp.]|nr:YheC/YheD family protein [Alicyclobacillus sp.]